MYISYFSIKNYSSNNKCIIILTRLISIKYKTKKVWIKVKQHGGLNEKLATKIGLINGSKIYYQYEPQSVIEYDRYRLYSDQTGLPLDRTSPTRST